MSLFAWILFLFALAIINYFIGNNSLKVFLSRHPSIDSPQSMDAFKKTVWQQMYQALIQLLLLLATGFLPIYGWVTDKITTVQFILCLLLDGVIILLGTQGKKVEEKARSLQVNDQILKDEYKKVCHTWVKKPFPDF